MKLSRLICIFVSAAFLPVFGREAALDPDARNATPVAPRVVTEPVKHDTVDPAIWINRADPAASLIIGTDKDSDGALYVFGLDGKIHWEKTVHGMARPNNVDIAHGVPLAGGTADIAVTTERYAN